MENNKNKKSVKFQGDVLNFCDFIQVFVFTRNHHLNLDYFLVLILLKCIGSVYLVFEEKQGDIARCGISSW